MLAINWPIKSINNNNIMPLMLFNLLFLFNQLESDDLTSSTPTIATMPDPRHKHLGFLRPASRISAHSKLLALATAGHESSKATGAATMGDEGSTDVQEAEHRGHRPTVGLP